MNGDLRDGLNAPLNNCDVLVINMDLTGESVY